MPSFINEHIVYKYMTYRYQQKKLLLYPKIIAGKIFGSRQKKPIKIKYLKQEGGTIFPDFDEIKINNKKRPAEIKFATSKFNYHKDSEKKFKDFKKKKGIIICLKHDCLPNGLHLNSGIDVYEINKDDFMDYCKNNFLLLFSRQINLHFKRNIWIMYSSDNYNGKPQYGVKPARETHRWAPQLKLGDLELGKGDLVLLIRRKGGDANLNKWLNKSKKKNLNKEVHIHPEVKISEINILRVTSDICSREEYCYKYRENNIKPSNSLWPLEKPGEKKWKTIFEFETIMELTTPFKIIDLFKSKKTKEIAEHLFHVCIQSKWGRKLDEDQYIELLHFLLKLKNILDKKPNISEKKSAKRSEKKLKKRNKLKKKSKR